MKKTLILGVALVIVLAGCGQGMDNEKAGNVDNSPQQPEAGQQQSPPQQGGQTQQQQLSPSEQAQSVVSQGEELLDQFGDSITEEERNNLETSLEDLEELSENSNISQQELQSAMQEVQEAVQPISEAVQQQQSPQQ